MKKLMGDQDHIKENLFAYVQGFSPYPGELAEIDAVLKGGTDRILTVIGGLSK